MPAGSRRRRPVASTRSRATEPQRLGIVVADDHPCVSEFLERYLAGRGMRILAVAEDGLTALDAILAHRPDVAVIDLKMPFLGGIELLERLADAGVATPVLIYTGYGSHGTLAEAVEAGARGFVDKSSSLQELVRAIHTIGQGGTYFDSGGFEAPSRELRGATGLARLTARELEILARASRGRTTAQIGRELDLSSSTVRTHFQNAQRKLGARNRTHAVVQALRQAMIA